MLFNIVVVYFLRYVSCEISDSAFFNKLIPIKPVGARIAKNFVPLTEIPPPYTPDFGAYAPHEHVAGRRHNDHNADCPKLPEKKTVYEEGQVAFAGEYYDDLVAKTMATVIIPDHIDHKHFEVTVQVPYFTVGPIEAIGYHPTTPKSDHPPECEKIYQDHMAAMYSYESKDYSEESLEMARMPLWTPDDVPSSMEKHLANMYDDVSSDR